MVLRFIGEATTDENGLAVLEDGYTGTGAGLVDIIAQTTIDESTVVSQPSTVIDALFKDMGTSTDYGNWSNWTGYEPKITRDTYCKVEVDTANSKTLARMYKQFDASSNNVCIEFDVKIVASSSSEIFGTLRNNSGNVLGNLDSNRFGGTTGTWHHLKIVVTSTNAKVYLDNSSSAYTYSQSGITRLYIDFDTDITELDYKNFVIYPV